MPSRSRLFWILLMCVPLIQVAPLVAQPTTPPDKSKNSIPGGANALKQALTKMGYLMIQLERTKYGHLVANLQIEGKDRKHDLRMVIDCGSSFTLLTPDAAKTLGLSVDKTNGTAAGVGGSGIAVSTTRAKALKIGTYEEKEVSLLVIDISSVNTMFTGSGDKPVDGVIGSDWMLAKKALIDMESSRLFVLPPRGK